MKCLSSADTLLSLSTGKGSFIVWKESSVVCSRKIPYVTSFHPLIYLTLRNFTWASDFSPFPIPVVLLKTPSSLFFLHFILQVILPHGSLNKIRPILPISPCYHAAKTGLRPPLFAPDHYPAHGNNYGLVPIEYLVKPRTMVTVAQQRVFAVGVSRQETHPGCCSPTEYGQTLLCSLLQV